MHLGIAFLWNCVWILVEFWWFLFNYFVDFLMGVLEGGFFKNRALAAAGAGFFRIRGSKLAAKIDQKTINTWSPRWNASWYRFLMDFGGYLEANWVGKSIKNRSKAASKKRCKNEGRQDGQKNDPSGRSVHLRSSTHWKSSPGRPQASNIKRQLYKKTST